MTFRVLQQNRRVIKGMFPILMESRKHMLLLMTSETLLKFRMRTQQLQGNNY